MNVADKYASAVTKNLGFGCNSRPCSAGRFSLSCIHPPWSQPIFFWDCPYNATKMSNILSIVERYYQNDFFYKGISILKAGLDYSYHHHKKSCENWNFSFPAQTELFYWLRSQCSDTKLFWEVVWFFSAALTTNGRANSNFHKILVWWYE